MTRYLFSFLSIGAVLASTAMAADPRIVDSLSGVVGLAPGQTAVLNVVDDGSSGSPALTATLAIFDGKSNLLAIRTVALTRRTVESLSFRHDGRAGRIPLRGLVRPTGNPADVSQPFPAPPD